MTALNSAPLARVPAHNLPVQLTSFVGRQRDIERVGQLLGETRLLTLTGTGGVGKTRLALQVAANLLGEYQDGVWLVELDSVFEPQLVVHKASSTLGCRREGAETRLAALSEHLHRKDLLLVLDNCEHLVQVCAEMVAGLLHGCARLTVLATSREPLGVPGEMVYEVTPLSLPQPEQQLTPDSLARFEAVQLFIERVGTLQPAFQVDEVSLPPIARICTMLDGIPLAVELAAARIRVLSPAQIAEQLEHSTRFLASGARTVVSRQKTLQASIDWSHNLLDVPEQTLFRRLAIFAGEFLIGDVQAVCADHVAGDLAAEPGPAEPSPALENEAIIDLLANLVDKSLVRAAPAGETIFRLLNPIQRFAWKKLSASGEKDLLRDRHLNYYLELIERVKPLLRGADQTSWLERVELELDNLRAALEWSLQRGAAGTGLRLACELGEFWWRRGYSSEGSDWFNRLLDCCTAEDSTRARALAWTGLLSMEKGDYRQAESSCTASLELSQMLGYQEGIAGALCLLGQIAHNSGDNAGAHGYFTDGLALYRQVGDEWNIALYSLLMANVQIKAGDSQAAARSSTESLALFRNQGNLWGIAWALESIGKLAISQGDYEHALASLSESVKLNAQIGDKLGLSFSMEAQAITLGECGQYADAARLWGFTEAFRQSVHSSLPPIHQVDYDPYIKSLRSALGEQAFDMAWNEGRSLTLEQATTLAVQFSPGEPAIRATDQVAETVQALEQYRLTPRELEVLRLVARGLTDAQVAEELVISPRTVSKHLQSIYGKLQVSSRSAATRFAMQNDLV